MIEYDTKLERKRAIQFATVEDIVYGVRHKMVETCTMCGIARGLKKLRDYLNKEFPVKQKETR